MGQQWPERPRGATEGSLLGLEVFVGIIRETGGESTLENDDRKKGLSGSRLN